MLRGGALSVTWAPTAKDLYGRGQGVYLDFAGEALRPGCTYATDSARYTSLAESAVYAHIARQSDRPGFLAVQYWLYWYYNDWNDKHESEWEFIQVLFRASSVEQALTQAPVSVGYAQHQGGEVSDWTSDKLERDVRTPSCTRQNVLTPATSSGTVARPRGLRGFRLRQHPGSVHSNSPPRGGA